MSCEPYDIVDESVLQEERLDARWEQEIVAHLPKELEEHALRLGAMQRKSGKITRASDLLRGLLAYVLCVSSCAGTRSVGSFSGISGSVRYELARTAQKSECVAGVAVESTVANPRSAGVPVVEESRL